MRAPKRCHLDVGLSLSGTSDLSMGIVWSGGCRHHGFLDISFQSLEGVRSAAAMEPASGGVFQVVNVPVFGYRTQASRKAHGGKGVPQRNNVGRGSLRSKGLVCCTVNAPFVPKRHVLHLMHGPIRGCRTGDGLLTRGRRASAPPGCPSMRLFVRGGALGDRALPVGTDRRAVCACSS